jgi:hypothetical protein
MNEVLDALVLAIVVVVAVVTGLAWLVSRRVRHAVAAWRPRLLGLQEACRTPGPGRDAARLRRRLGSEVVATQQTLDEAPAGVVFRADARELLSDIRAVAGELDRDLRSVERFADPVQQRAALAALTPQVEQLISTSYSARQTIISTAVRDRDRTLSNLSDRVAAQAAAADRYRQAGPELSL